MKINLEELQAKFEQALAEIYPHREFKIPLTNFVDRKPDEWLGAIDVSFRIRESLKHKDPGQIVKEFWDELDPANEEH